MIGQGQAIVPDSLRAIIDTVLSAPAYQVRAPRDGWAPVRRLWWALLDWIEQLRTANPVAYRVLVFALVAVLVAVVAHALWIAARTIHAGTAPPERGTTGVVTSPRDADWYRAEADRLAAGGRIAEAMQADFLRLVLELDARKVTRFHPSKTPIEYAREAVLEPDARRDFRSLVSLLYAHAFARLAASPETWSRWRAEALADRYASAH
ncbi:MAG: DUF4129 domain-containing protein [Gemmatimonadaceae bacterium]